MSIYLGDTPLAHNAVSRNIGEIIQSTIPLSDAGLHLLDGALINGSGSYSAFVTYIAGLVSNYPDLFTTETAWQQAVTDYGVCGKFVYDSINKTVRLPKITGFTEGTTDVTALGDLIEAGLPNVIGRFGAWESNNSHKVANDGPFTTTSTGGGEQNGNGTWNTTTMNLSRANPIYGNSTTVQPQAIKVLYYIVIATSTKTDIEVDIDEIMTDLNGKADVDLSNVKASGTSLASGWAMPSTRYDNLTLGASGSTYTAPANGYFVLNKLTSNTNQYANFINKTNGMNTTLSYPTSGSNIRIYMPVLKGHIVSCSYSVGGTTQWFRFIYAEGESNV